LLIILICYGSSEPSNGHNTDTLILGDKENERGESGAKKAISIFAMFCDFFFDPCKARFAVFNTARNIEDLEIKIVFRVDFQPKRFDRKMKMFQLYTVR